MKNSFKDRTGFTIIEVLIVLAIAGLIMLIVFLAVPALQRNSRNQGIRSDAGNIMSSVNEFVSNNNGQLPVGGSVVCQSNGDVTISGASGGGTQPSSTKVRPGTTCGLVTSDTFAVGNVNIRLNVKCNGNSATQANNRSFVALFAVETGSGTANQCIES